MAEIIASMPFSKPISPGREYKSPATMRLDLSGKSSFATSTNVVNSLMHEPMKRLLQGRLLLVHATIEALRWGLHKLGIPAPQRM